MTFLRRKALEISSWVTWLAPPACKEWAEGLEREAEFIESDWRALVWAIGSARILMDRRSRAGQETPPRPPMWRAFPFILCSLALEDWAYMLRASNWHDRLAWGLVACGFTEWMIRTLANALWERREPPVSDRPAYWAFRRASLQRDLQRLRSPRRMFALLAIVSMGTGYVMTLEGWGNSDHISAGLITVGTLFCVWIWSRETPASVQARFQRLDERIAKALGPDLKNWKSSALPLRSDHWGGRT